MTSRAQPLPGAGIDRQTGNLISGWPHVVQSLGVIFTTRLGERVMRRFFGSFVPAILGRNLTPATMLRFWTAICVAIDMWEPRFKVRRIEIPRDENSPEQLRLGRLKFAIHGEYRPRGHLGDPTPDPEGARVIYIGQGARDGVIVL